MEKLVISIGLNDKDKKTQVINNDNAMKLVNNCFTSKLEAFTTYFAKGVYTHDNGAIVEENTIRVEVVTFTDKDKTNTIKAIKDIKALLNQESVLLETQLINSVLL